MAPRCILIGPPGAGKTTIGRLLSQAWLTPLIDTDQVVAERAGKSVSEIFIDDGEPAFRAMEAEAVRAALDVDDGVVALGGGAVMTETTARLLEAQASPIVFLDVTISSAAPRVGFNRDRPLLIGNPRASWLALMEQRRPIYHSLATITVNTDDRDPEQISAEIKGLVDAL